MMLETARRIASGSGGFMFEADKIVEWLARLPLAADAALIEDWPGWSPGRQASIATAVLRDGYTAEAAAGLWETNPQTVRAVVAAHRMILRRT
jgi:hypothetical protein